MSQRSLRRGGSVAQIAVDVADFRRSIGEKRFEAWDYLVHFQHVQVGVATPLVQRVFARIGSVAGMHGVEAVPDAAAGTIHEAPHDVVLQRRPRTWHPVAYDKHGLAPNPFRCARDYACCG